MMKYLLEISKPLITRQCPHRHNENQETKSRRSKTTTGGVSRADKLSSVQRGTRRNQEARAIATNSRAVGSLAGSTGATTIAIRINGKRASCPRARATDLQADAISATQSVLSQGERSIWPKKYICSIVPDGR